MNITKSCLHRVWECFAAFSAKERALKQTLFYRTSFMEHFHFHTNLKFNWENLIFRLLKMYLFSRIGHFKKNNIERTRISMWFGRENDENVVRTRDWCGWPSSPRSSFGLIHWKKDYLFGLIRLEKDYLLWFNPMIAKILLIR